LVQVVVVGADFLQLASRFWSHSEEKLFDEKR
jgi:hypothetical protein